MDSFWENMPPSSGVSPKIRVNLRDIWCLSWEEDWEVFREVAMENRILGDLEGKGGSGNGIECVKYQGRCVGTQILGCMLVELHMRKNNIQ